MLADDLDDKIVVLLAPLQVKLVVIRRIAGTTPRGGMGSSSSGTKMAGSYLGGCDSMS
jgi:hypothetical protein